MSHDVSKKKLKKLKIDVENEQVQTRANIWESYWIVNFNGQDTLIKFIKR